MLRLRVLCCVFGLTALLAVTAVCQNFDPGKSGPLAPKSPPAPTSSDPGDSSPTLSTPSFTSPPRATPESTIPAVTKQAGVDDLLDKLEGLKAKREAIEREEKATHALLLERLKAQQDRMGKLGVGPQAPPACEKKDDPYRDEVAPATSGAGRLTPAEIAPKRDSPPSTPTPLQPVMN